MKKTTYLLLFLICFCFSSAQTEDVYQTTISKISEAYNTQNADMLFNQFAPDLQSSFTLEAVKKFIARNHESRGTIGDFSFLTDDDLTKRYLVEFDEASVILSIRLTVDGKISKLAFEEY